MARPYPLTRGYGFQWNEPQPTGEGERTLHEKLAGWSYHQSEGWRMIDYPLGPAAALDEEKFRDALKRSGFGRPTGLLIQHGMEERSRVEVYERRTSNEYLIAWFMPVGHQLIIAKGLPALIHVLNELRDIVIDTGKAFAAATSGKKPDEDKS